MTFSDATSTRQGSAAQAMLAAMVILGISDNAVPLMAEQIGIWQFYLMRTAIALPLVWVMARAGSGGIKPVRIGAVVLRGMLLAVAMVFYFSAVALMPMAQALAGLFTSPILIVLISVLFLRHRIGLVRISAVTFGFLGVLFVLQPDPYEFDWLILLPVAGGCFMLLALWQQV
ncbi:DMT family transporter [Phycobacter azelaicus]|uniref:DMT family transporter n=1 Tax=Phycobacter azelaicus TaxID=2668075 RepID=UPI001D0252A3|nr:DMT family transporter [Phycobacter azelaicus]